MNKKLLLIIAIFTVFGCCIFVSYNPTIAQKYASNFIEGEVFTPQNGHFDFKEFTLTSSKTKNFTTRIISNGHTQFVDDTGKITVNYIELDKMIQIKKDEANSFLNGELKKPSWYVNGVLVHEIDFENCELYSAYHKNSSENTIIYLSTTSERETADLMNSLR